MFRRFFEQLGRWYDQQETPTKIAAIAGVLLALAVLQQVTARRSGGITRLEAQQLLTQGQEEALQHAPEARAEARRLREHPRRGFVYDVPDPHTPVTRLAGRTGQASFEVQYGDGFFYVNDLRHWADTADPDPVDLLDDRRSVAAGSRGQVMVGGCCEEGGAHVTLVLLERPPAALPPPGLPWVSDMDLDLATGRLVFAGNTGTQRVVALRSSQYRMRVAGNGAGEGDEEPERFRIELWPREHDGADRDGGLRVLRPVSG